MIAVLFWLIIGVVPHPSDPYYECMLIVRPQGMSVLCAPGGNVTEGKWTGVCNRGDRCPNP